MDKPRVIGKEIMTGHLPNGYEIKDSDVGQLLYWNFGRVLSSDVGKQCWVNDMGQFQIETPAQADRRKVNA